jgi:hypothetical protein
LPLALIAVGLFGLRNAYTALKSGESSGGKAPVWGSVKYYDRATRPGMFWFMVVLNVGGALFFVFAGLVLLVGS